MNLSHFTTIDIQAEIDKLKKSLKEYKTIFIQSSPEYLAAFEKACIDHFYKQNKND